MYSLGLFVKLAAVSDWREGKCVGVAAVLQEVCVI